MGPWFHNATRGATHGKRAKTMPRSKDQRCEQEQEQRARGANERDTRRNVNKDRREEQKQKNRRREQAQAQCCLVFAGRHRFLALPFPRCLMRRKTEQARFCFSQHKSTCNDHAWSTQQSQEHAVVSLSKRSKASLKRGSLPHTMLTLRSAMQQNQADQASSRFLLLHVVGLVASPNDFLLGPDSFFCVSPHPQSVHHGRRDP